MAMVFSAHSLLHDLRLAAVSWSPRHPRLQLLLEPVLAVRARSAWQAGVESSGGSGDEGLSDAGWGACGGLPAVSARPTYGSRQRKSNRNGCHLREDRL